jgi:hypothetical protein
MGLEPVPWPPRGYAPLLLAFMFHPWVPVCICSALGFAIFANTLGGELVWDDRAAVLLNADVLPESPLSNLLFNDFWGQSMSLSDSHKSYRPVTVLTYKLNYWLHGVDPFGYHLVNVGLHALCCGLAAKLATRIFEETTLQRQGRAVDLPSHEAAAFGCFVGVLFAVHPIHTEAVACIVGRADILCCLFFFLAMLLYIESCALPLKAPQAIKRDDGGVALPARPPSSASVVQCLLVALSALFTALSTLSKEIGVTVIPILMLWEVLVVLRLQKCVVRSGHYERPSARCVGQSIGRIVVVLFFGLGVLTWRFRLHGDSFMYKWSILENNIQHLPPGFPKFASYAYVHARYFLLFWVPYPLCYDYGFDAVPVVESVHDARNVTTVCMYLIMLSILREAIMQLLGSPGTTTMAPAVLGSNVPAPLPSPATSRKRAADENVASTLEKLAATLVAEGRVNEAEPLCTQARAIRNKLKVVVKKKGSQEKVRMRVG